MRLSLSSIYLFIALMISCVSYSGEALANVTPANETTTPSTDSRISSLQNRAQQQDRVAQYELAMAYRFGNGVPPSVSESLYWLTEAANNHSTAAAFELAKHYLNGKQTQRDTELGLYWLTTLAQQGNAQAQFQLGQWLENNSTSVNANELAAIWYQIAAPTNEQANNAYERLLESQFNAQRAKRIAAMNQLDSQEIEISRTETNNELSDTSPHDDLLDEKQTDSLLSELSRLNLPNSALTMEAKDNALILLGMTCSALSLFSFVLWRKLSAFTKRSSRPFSSNPSLARTALARESLSQHAGMYANNDRPDESHRYYEEQLKIRDKKLHKQKLQLDTLYRAFKAQQSEMTHSKLTAKTEPSEQLALACAMLGFEMDSLPNRKQIKVRYKQLSQLYHPDRLGSQEEMKRLNHALKVILAHVNK